MNPLSTIAASIESLLFVEPKPVSIRQISKLLDVTPDEVKTAIEELQAHHAERKGGMVVVVQDDAVQLTTAPDFAEFIAGYLKQDGMAELTRPSLETLTIIAYRGPVPKSQIELIRGVNCSLILRNLMIRGLIEQVGETETGTPVYQVTIDFLRHIGLTEITELPDYEELNTNVHLQELLEKQAEDFFAQNNV